MVVHWNEAFINQEKRIVCRSINKIYIDGPAYIWELNSMLWNLFLSTKTYSFNTIRTWNYYLNLKIMEFHFNGSYISQYYEYDKCSALLKYTIKISINEEKNICTDLVYIIVCMYVCTLLSQFVILLLNSLWNALVCWCINYYCHSLYNYLNVVYRLFHSVFFSIFLIPMEITQPCLQVFISVFFFFLFFFHTDFKCHNISNYRAFFHNRFYILYVRVYIYRPPIYILDRHNNNNNKERKKKPKEKLIQKLLHSLFFKTSVSSANVKSL